MNLNQLRVFCAIVEEGSFRQAGEKLFLSQPSVSQYIAALEKNYDVKLFMRRGRSISLTPEGRTLYILAQDLFKLVDAVPEKFREMQLLKYGELCIGTTPTCGKTFLPLIMSEYRHKFPHIKVQIKTANEETLLTMIEKDEIELAFFGHNPLLSPSSTLTMQSLGRSSFALIAPPDHPWAQWKIISPAQLLEENFISYSKDTAHYCFVNDFFLNNKLKTPRLTQVDNEELLLQLVTQGFGIGIAMEIAVRKEVKQKEVIILSLQNLAGISREIFLAHSTIKGLTYAGWEMGKVAEQITFDFLNQG
jgi:DNA-binding transcriptional LysR family regulator